MPSERDADLVERLVDRQVLPGGTYLTFVRDTVVASDGRQHTRDGVLHPGAVAIAALLPDGRILLVRQYRHSAGEVMTEIPAGTLDKLDDGSIEEPLPAAKRELFEETGHRAGSWRKLAEFFTAPGFASELMHLFLATDLKADPTYEGPEPDERLKLESVPFDEALGWADKGEIRDAKTLIGFYMVDRLARAGEIPELKDSTARHLVRRCSVGAPLSRFAACASGVRPRISPKGVIGGSRQIWPNMAEWCCGGTFAWEFGRFRAS